MASFVDNLGTFIQGQVPNHPDRARALLTAAYSWVQLSGKLSSAPDAARATDHANAAVASTLTKSFRHPENAVMVSMFTPCEILHAMGIQPLFPEGLSVYLACTNAVDVFVQAAEEADIPETFCSYHKTMIGVAETGVMPAPRLIMNTTIACDANNLSFRRLADFYGIDQVLIDVPHAMDEDAVAYVADQLRAAVPAIEEAVGRSLDADKLRETMAVSAKTLASLDRYLAARPNVSLHSTTTGEMCTVIASHVMLGRPEALAYMEEMEGYAADAAQHPVNPQLARILWLHTLPNWQMSLRDILETSTAAEIVGCDMAVDALGVGRRAVPIDVDKPFESMARRVVYGAFNGPATNRANVALSTAQQLGADGAIVFCHWGCKQTLGASQLIKETFEQSGIPCLVLDGDGCDRRNVAEGQMITRLNAFIEQLQAKRRA